MILILRKPTSSFPPSWFHQSLPPCYHRHHLQQTYWGCNCEEFDKMSIIKIKSMRSNVQWLEMTHIQKSYNNQYSNIKHHQKKKIISLITSRNVQSKHMKNSGSEVWTFYSQTWLLQLTPYKNILIYPNYPIWASQQFKTFVFSSIQMNSYLSNL